ncbi:MAG: DUF3108 domain-containing protein [Phaeospirillum sp.]|nr:DUF3108 domain-containing protein [Phaeospirillum sp.]
MKASLLGIVTITLAAAPAMAEPVGFRYEIMWGGFHAGDLAITRDDRESSSRTGMSIRTVGLFDKLLRLRFSAEGSSRLTHGADPASESYQTRYRNRYQEHLLRIVFGLDGEPMTMIDEVVERFAPPPDDDEPNPPVTPESRRGAMDPLTNVTILGRKARAALEGGPTHFRTASFDGRRAYDFEVTVLGRGPISIRDREFDAIALRMVLAPVAGFKAKFRRLWEDAEYTVHLDPDSLLPLRVMTDSFTAATVINALEPCRVAAEQCAPRLTGNSR